MLKRKAFRIKVSVLWLVFNVIELFMLHPEILKWSKKILIGFIGILSPLQTFDELTIKDFLALDLFYASWAQE